MEGHIENIRLVNKQNIVAYDINPGHFNLKIFIRRRIRSFISWASDSKKQSESALYKIIQGNLHFDNPEK